MRWCALLLAACCSVLSCGVHLTRHPHKHPSSSQKSPHDKQLNSLQKVLIVNIIGDNAKQLEHALKHAFDFVATLKKEGDDNLLYRAFFPSLQPSNSSPNLDVLIKQMEGVTGGPMKTYPPTLENHNIGSSSNSQKEHVTEILFSLSNVEQEFRSSFSQPVALSLAFSSQSFPVLRSVRDFYNIFFRVSHDNTTNEKNVLVLEKNSELTSPSDWHDIQVVVMALATARSTQWLEVLHRVYMHHADRPAFTLLEPRVAILESIYSSGSRPHVGFMNNADVCLLREGEIQNNVCVGTSSYSVSLLMKCTCPVSGTRRRGTSNGCACSSLFRPTEWKSRLGVPPSKINDRMGQDIPSFLKNLPEVNKFGISRFRHTTESDMPQGFCWETGDKDFEKKSESRIYEDSTSSVPFIHPDDPSDSTATVAIISASGSNGLDKEMDMSLSRKYYAYRHGYSYKHLVSEPYANYFGDNFLDLLFSMGDSYPKNVMSKVPMIVSQMYAYIDEEWIMWMDDDTWFNPGWLHISLDAFLRDVPPKKLVVLGNHRSAQSNVLFIRNSAEGRKLGRDWLSIATSGYVQCHGFDQGALEMLIVSRLYEHIESRHRTENITHNPRTGKSHIRDPTPFNFTCLNEKWMRKGLMSNDFYSRILGPNASYESPYAWGCNGGADWSCDFKFERVLRNIGFVGLSSGFHMPLSSFSQGCANEFFPEFHITYETVDRPRLHVGFCSRLDEIQGTDFCYDGPLGGGNDFVRRNAINGWFINHKADINFYEAYRDKNACRKIDSFVANCNKTVLADMLKEEKPKSDHLVLLTGGYGYDIETNNYCWGGEELLSFQKKNTYMEFYAQLITAAKNFAADEWNEKQNSVVNGTYKAIQDFKKYFHPPKYCKHGCTKRRSPLHQGHVLACHKPT